MKNGPAACGAFAAAAFALALAGCGAEVSQEARDSAPGPAPLGKASLEEGTAISLVLLEPIVSGRVTEGTRVEAAVLEDVTSADGQVLVAAGTQTLVEVAQSRDSSPADQLLNRPARLSLRFTSLPTGNGSEAPLRAAAQPGEAELEVEAGEVEDSAMASRIKGLQGTARFPARLESVREGLSQVGGRLSLEDLRPELEVLSQDLDMTQTQAALKDPVVWRALTAAVENKKASELAELNAAGRTTALAALAEMGALASTANRDPKGAFQGNAIILPAGAEIVGYAAATVEVSPGSSPRTRE